MLPKILSRKFVLVHNKNPEDPNGTNSYETLETHPLHSLLIHSARSMNTLKRTLAGIFGAVLLAIVVPIAYYFAFKGLPLEGFQGVLLLAGVGAVLGAILGALFPQVFGFIFEMFLDP
ncbi:MAG: hypothetical protein AAGJ31_15260 [Verrucomicrobiota bacterium]